MKVLCVEDNEDSLELLRVALEGSGHEAVLAHDGAEALEVAKETGPDIVLSDIMMPIMDGFELCQRMKTNAELNHIPFVFYTATYVDPKDEALAFALGASRFVVKPMEIPDLVNAIEEVIREHEIMHPVPQKPLVDAELADRMHLERVQAKLEKKYAELAEEKLLRNRDHLEGLVIERTEDVKGKAHQLERALESEKQISALLQEFVALVSHEFRTPLTIIDATAQRLLRHKDGVPPDELKTRLKKIRNAVVRMTGMIEKTLYVSRLDVGKVEMTPVWCDLKAMVKEVCSRQDDISPSHKINIDIDALADDFYVDEQLLEQVFTNLTSNAVKYTPSNKDQEVLGEMEKAPDIHIKGWMDGDVGVISVRDAGIGIPCDELPNMFKRFFRASTAKGISGTGIGLSIVHDFIAMHYGTIKVDSAEGRGATFTVRLPVDFRNALDPLC